MLYFQQFHWFLSCFQDALIKISKTEGLTSLWSGLSPTLVLAVPATVIYFVSYEQLRLYLKVKNTMSYIFSFIYKFEIYVQYSILLIIS